MQGVELEPRIDSVGHAQPRIKAGIAGLTHRQFIQCLAWTGPGPGTEEILKHDHVAPFPPRR